LAGPTPIALFRRGNATGPRLDHIRAGIDVAIFVRDGVEWVVGRSGGVSTFSRSPPPGGGRVWTLDAGSDYPDILFLNNDHADHWAWEPTADMPISDYRAALYDLATLFH
jgi:hypothetical protein